MKKIRDSELQETLNNFLPFDGMFRVNTELIKEIMNHELISINKGQLYVTSVLNKLERYNERYLRRLDILLDKVIDSTGDLDIYQLNKLIRYSTKLYSELYDGYIANISELDII